MDAHTQEIYLTLQKVVREASRGIAITQVLEEQLLESLGSIIKAHGIAIICRL